MTKGKVFMNKDLLIEPADSRIVDVRGTMPDMDMGMGKKMKMRKQ